MSSQTRKLFSSMLVFILMQIGIVAAQAATPPPPTLTVTDNGANPTEAPVIHWSQFSTNCSAAVANAPQSTQETTITGPDYQWSCSNPGPGYTVTQTGAPSTTLTSASGLELTAGNNTVTVYCTATYSSTDKKTGVVTPISVSGSTDVKFFVRVPVRLQAIFTVNYKVIGPPYWGHETHYAVELLDNQAVPAAYTDGTVSEVFSNVQCNPKYAYDLINKTLVPGTPSTDFPASQLTEDVNRCYNDAWTNPPPSDTGDTTLWYQFDQTWTSKEMGIKKTLNTFIIYHQQGKALRL